MTETIPESTFANAWCCSACGASVPFGLILVNRLPASSANGIARYRVPHECPKSHAGAEFYLDTAPDLRVARQ